MTRIKQALIEIQDNQDRASEILEAEVEHDRRQAIEGLAAFVVAALDGVVVDPANL